MDGLTDEFERPLQFRPTWPPPAEGKAAPNFRPGFSLAFRKSNWPPPSDDGVTDSSSGELNGPSAAGSAGSDGASTGVSPSQNNVPGGRPAAGAVKPKRPAGDYSAFFSKNALPHHEVKFVVKPDKVRLPEVFLGNPEEEEN